MANDDHLTLQAELDAELDAARTSTLHGPVQTSLEQAQRALGLSRQLGNTANEAECQMLLARAQMRLANYLACAEHGAQALHLWSRLQRPADQAEAMALSAAACGEMYAHQAALSLAQDLSVFATHHHLSRYLPRALHIMAACYWRMGQSHDAELLMLQTLSRSREGSDYGEEARALNGLLAGSNLAVDQHLRLGETEQAQANVQRVMHYLSQAQAAMARAEVPLLKATLGLNIAMAHLLSGKQDKAEPLLEASLQTCRAAGYRALAMTAAEWLARLRQRQGRPQEALDLLAELLAEADHPSMVGLLADAHATQALALRDLGQAEAAEQAQRDEQRLRQRMAHAKDSALPRLLELQRTMHETLLEFDRQALVS
nr:hypothetical protein [uncultured Roseateles sp.]